MEWFLALMGFLGGLAGSTVSSLVVARIERKKMSAAIQAQWDSALLTCATQLVAAARRLRHHSERLQRTSEANQPERRKDIDRAHEELRILTEQLRIVGNPRVQRAARLVQHHAYAVRVLGEEGRDPRGTDHPERDPIERLNDALREFYRSVRGQLRAPDPEDVIYHDSERALGLPSLPPESRSQQA